MVLRATVTLHDELPIPLLVDSSRRFPLLLEDGAWKKAGVDVRTLVAVGTARLASILVTIRAAAPSLHGSTTRRSARASRKARSSARGGSGSCGTS